ncbi:hypothetical protein [Caulobacter segnis]
MIGALIAQVRDGVRRIWCFKWLAFWVATVLVLVGAPIVMSLPKVYEAWAQIYVAKETPLGSAAQGVSLVGQGYGDPYVVEKTLLNDESLRKLLHRLDPATRGLTPGRTALAVQALKGKIRVSPSVDDGFFELHVLDSDPIRARNTVQWLIDEFMSRNLARNQDALSDATRFLDQQMAIYRQMLDQSNIRLETFRAQHPGVAATALPAMILPISGGQVETRSAAGPAPTHPATVMLAQANERLAALDTRLAALRSEYTDEHPDVVAARRQQAMALAQRAELALKAPPAASAATIRRFQGSSSGGARATPTASPQAMAEWADLNRSDLMLRTNYDQLAARREAARLSQAAYGDGSGKYQITRPPTAPQLPIGPNRKLYLAALLALAAVGGIASAFVYAAMKGIFVSPRELELILGLPVAGTVSWEPAWSTKRSKKRGGGRGAPRQAKLGANPKRPLSYDPARAPWSAS